MKYNAVTELVMHDDFYVARYRWRATVIYRVCTRVKTDEYKNNFYILGANSNHVSYFYFHFYSTHTQTKQQP